MNTPDAAHVISAPEAAALAGITYRQLDHWARQGWVSPSVDRGRGRSARRLYSPDDVVRLAALRHFGGARADGALGRSVGALRVPEGDVLVVADADGTAECVPAARLRARVSRGGPYLVFDPAPLRARLAARAARTEPARGRVRRSA